MHQPITHMRMPPASQHSGGRAAMMLFAVLAGCCPEAKSTIEPGSVPDGKTQIVYVEREPAGRSRLGARQRELVYEIHEETDIKKVQAIIDKLLLERPVEAMAVFDEAAGRSFGRMWVLTPSNPVGFYADSGGEGITAETLHTTLLAEAPKFNALVGALVSLADYEAYERAGKHRERLHEAWDRDKRMAARLQEFEESLDRGYRSIGLRLRPWHQMNWTD